MKTLAPPVDTYWFAYKDGVLQTGVTEPDQVTCVCDDCEFEHGPDVATKVAKYKDKLRQSNTDHPATPGLYNHNGKVVKLDDADCAGKKHSLDAAEKKAVAEAKAG